MGKSMLQLDHVVEMIVPYIHTGQLPLLTEENTVSQPEQARIPLN